MPPSAEFQFLPVQLPALQPRHLYRHRRIVDQRLAPDEPF